MESERVDCYVDRNVRLSMYFDLFTNIFFIIAPAILWQPGVKVVNCTCVGRRQVLVARLPWKNAAP